MATKRMLIDASHPEEVRVVVVDGTKLDEYDVEVASRRQLKGNIYLAKVTRVEPSLQAAFVDYGGNRHGFLAFNEIHPDYYQIPVADRQALIAEHEAAERAADGDEGGDTEATDDDDDFERRRPRISPRNYKIQEVIKRRQIMLVQVAKEERGSKGAALTSYLSLAGRYCVLMPNTSRGGGISRKINNATDRKRLKKILNELEVPEGMGVIVRTAGAGRTKAEIKRDYEYLIRLWSSIREVTLGSMAPALVYEEGNLIKRSIRDLYGRDIEEIVLQGEPEYRTAKEFMKLFIPSHAKRIKLYEEGEKPLFQRSGVEDQIEAMHQPVVQLKSGSYIVINPTEALVSIDVNSGRSTRERHIEETALRTNLEAADEIARQLRLRDLAGLIVIDFIDMENSRNQTMVERRLKEAMKNDRARVQIGRISPFGLLELSRQRLRPSLLETAFEVCQHCSGTGMKRTTESAVLSLLRRIEAEGIRHSGGEFAVVTPPAVASYLFNHKRRSLTAIEDRCHLSVRLSSDASMMGTEFRIERLRAQVPARSEDEPSEVVDEAASAVQAAEVEPAAAEGEDAGKRTRRRRPRRRRRTEEERAEASAAGGSGEEAEAETEEGIERLDEAESAEAEGEGVGEDAEAGDETAEQIKRRRRRGKRGGRRRGKRPEDTVIGEAAGEELAALGEAGAAAMPIDGDWPAVEPPLAEDESEAGEIETIDEAVEIETTDEVVEIETTDEAVAAGPEDTTVPEAAEPASEIVESPDESVALVQAPEPDEVAADAASQADDEVEHERQEDDAMASADEEARAGADGDGKDDVDDDAERQVERVSMIGAESADDERGEPRKGWWTRFMN